jgi:hypothetical protein
MRFERLGCGARPVADPHEPAVHRGYRPPTPEQNVGRSAFVGCHRQPPEMLVGDEQIGCDGKYLRTRVPPGAVRHQGRGPGAQNLNRPVIDNPSAAALDRDGDIPSRHRLIENAPTDRGDRVGDVGRDHAQPVAVGVIGPQGGDAVELGKGLAGAATCCPFNGLLVDTTNIE